MVVEDVQVKSEEMVDLTQLDAILDEYEGQEGVVIPVLQKTQELYGYLPQAALKRVSRRMRVPMSQIYGVATFYAQFYLTPRGRHTMRVCDGTACHVRGAATIVSALEEELGIKAGETTDDFRLTLEVVYCIGSCGLAPVAVIDDRVVGRLVPNKAVALVRELE